jgi:hypothetical protein
MKKKSLNEMFWQQWLILFYEVVAKKNRGQLEVLNTGNHSADDKLMRKRLF